MWQELVDDLRKAATAVLSWRREHSPGQFVVTCRNCQRAVPIGTTEFPFHSIRVCCCLCDDTESYRPSEVHFDLPHKLVRLQNQPGRSHTRPVGDSPALG